MRVAGSDAQRIDAQRIDAQWIDDAQWTRIQQLVPITCVDLVPLTGGDAAGSAHPAHGARFGLIERDSPFGRRWCQIGGRLRHGETLREGLLRHLAQTLTGLDVDLPPDPQPDYTMQWFPHPPAGHADGVAYGLDPRQHAVALCFTAVAPSDAQPVAVEGGEAMRFGWFTLAEVAGLGDRAWPGTAAMIAAIAARIGRQS